MLKTLSGAGLAKLTRQDFKERSPKQGDLIFTLWKELLNNKSTEELGSDSAKSPPNSPRKGKTVYLLLHIFLLHRGNCRETESVRSLLIWPVRAWITTLLVAYYMCTCMLFRHNILQ